MAVTPHARVSRRPPPEACLRDACPADARPPCLASSHATAIRATATAESCPKRAFSQPFPRSRASQNNSHSHHAIRQDASRQEVSRLSTLCTLSHCSIAAAPHTCRHGLGLKRTRQSTLAARLARQHELQRMAAANKTARSSQRMPVISTGQYTGHSASLFSPDTRDPTPTQPFWQAHRNAAGVHHHDERGVLTSILAASAEAL